MVNSIVIIKNNEWIRLSQDPDTQFPYFILNTVDWGTVGVDYNDTSYPGQFGVTFTSKQINSRDITIEGYVISPDTGTWGNNTYNIISPGGTVQSTETVAGPQSTNTSTNRINTMNTNKQFLNSFFVPEQEFQLVYDMNYYITFYLNNSIEYGDDSDSNNDTICSFTLDCTAPYPLFSALSEEQYESGDTEYKGIYTPLYFNGNEMQNNTELQNAETVNVTSNGVEHEETPETRLVAGANDVALITNHFTLQNNGDTTTGFIIEFYIEQTAENAGQTDVSVKNPFVYINNEGDENYQWLGLKTTITNGTVITVNTNVGEKSVTVTKYEDNETTTELDLNILDFSSDWIQLPRGQYTMTYGYEGDKGTASNLGITVSYTRKYYEVQSAE